MIQSAEIGRERLSPRIASEFSRTSGVDSTWLMSDDPTAPMIGHDGRLYSHKHFERAQANLRTLEGSQYRLRNLQLGVAFDLLHRLLAASRLKGKDDKTALKTGRIIALGLLTPTGVEPFKRGRESLGAAIAAFTARRVKPNEWA
jgi:hypothetical protein